MHTYKVGNHFQGIPKKYPEGPIYGSIAGRHQLVLFVDGISKAERNDLRKGAAHFALSALGPVLHLHFRFGQAFPWCLAPYNFHLNDRDPNPIPEKLDGTTQRALLTVALVEANNGKIRALRALTFDPGFSAALHEAITEQAQTRWDPALYDRSLNLTNTWSSEGLMHEYGFAQCRGGHPRT